MGELLTTPSESSARRRRSDGERSRAAILYAATQLATVEGLDGLSIGRLAEHTGIPPPGSPLDALLRAMLIPSDDAAANSLLVWLGGSTSSGAYRVNDLMRSIGLRDTLMYGGYLTRTLSSAIPT